MRRILMDGRGSLAALLVAVSLSPPLEAQDVELLGEIHGTRPPDIYYETLRADPDAYRFSREGPERLRLLRESPRLRSDVPGDFGALTIGPRDGPVQGTFRFPLVLGLFEDTPGGQAPFTRDFIQAEFFDGPNSYFQTIPELYDEMSGGRLELDAITYDWVQTGLKRQEVTRGGGGLGAHSSLGVGSYIEAILEELDSSGVDWSQFDISGDGYVDILTVMHPTLGRECLAGGGERIHSHRWSLASVTAGRLSQAQTGKVRHGFETSTPYSGPGGGNIHVNDYTIQAALDCSSNEPSASNPSPPLSVNRIGVFAHELGHALGLPDLYSTGSQGHYGSGNWDLMGTGAWGCGLPRDGSPNDSSRPCHMGAWSKAALGWVEEVEVGVEELMNITLEPVQHSGEVLRIPAFDGSREYLLLENRQRIGSDVNLFEPGLLVWHINPDVVDPRWPQNAVNTDPQRMGVRLVEADGRNKLLQSGHPSGRGSTGDPFPGCIRDNYVTPSGPCGTQTAFHVGTTPAALAQSGSALGVSLSNIALSGADPYDVTFTVDTRFMWDTIVVASSAEAVREQTVPVGVSGVPGPVSWKLVGGELPPGFSFNPASASLTGSTFSTGTFDFTLSAGDGMNRQVLALVTLVVTPPVIPFDDLVADYLCPPGICASASPLTPNLRTYLDQQGNQSGSLDLGDARAYIQSELDGEGMVAP
jgi:M6 family metalloprotease-like protein